MNTLNNALTARIETETAAALIATQALFAAMTSTPKYITDNIVANDYDMRMALTGDKRAQNTVSQGVFHGAWSEWLSAHDAHHLLIDREREAQYCLMFADSYRRTMYNGVKSLLPFTATNAADFFNANLLVTPAKRAAWLNDVLERSGKDFRNHNTAFKSKMSLRGLDSYGTVSNELARALYAACLALGINFTFDKFYTELRNNRRIDGAQFSLIDGLDLTIEWHQNGNATVRIGKALVTQLNDMVHAK